MADFEHDVPCWVMSTRACQEIIDGELVKRTEQCETNDCARFDRDVDLEAELANRRRRQALGEIPPDPHTPR